MRRASLLTILIFVAFEVNARAQSTTCVESIRQLPEVRGLGLSMATDEIKRRFPRFEPPRPDEYGYSELAQEFLSERDGLESYGEDPFEGIDKEGLAAVSVGLLDDRVIALVISYDDTVRWKGVADFLPAIAGALNLPEAKYWVQDGRDRAELSCPQYVIRVTTAPKRGAAAVAFYKLGVAEEVERRKAAAAERRRRNFKP